MWGSVLKTFARGSVKKVAAKKLLGRGKDQRRQRVQGIMEGEGGIDKSQNPKISFSSGIVAPTSSIVESSGGGVEGTLMRIKTSTVNIDTILRGSLKLDKLRENKKRKDVQNQKRANREGKLEKGKTGKTGKGFNIIPKMGFLDKTKNFIMNIIFGWLAIKMLKWAPMLAKILPALGKAADTLLKWGGKFFDGVAWMIGKGYEAIGLFRQGVGKVFGDQGVKIFDKFGDLFKKFVNYSLIAAMFGARAGMLGGNMGFGAGGIFRRGLGRTLPRLGLRLFGRAGMAKIVGAGGAIKGGLASAASTVGTVLTGTAAITTGAVAGAGLLSSALGEGAYKLNQWGEGREDSFKEKFQKLKWLENPIKKAWWGAASLVMLVLNRVFGFFGNLLDIIGAPFRYLIEALRHPFLDEAGKKKQRENLAKFDARIREGFRKTFNFLTLGLAFKQEGSFGSLYGEEGAGALNAKRTDQGEGYKNQWWDFMDLFPNKKKHKGGFIPVTGPYILKRKEIVIDPDSAGPAKDMLLAINQANTRTGIIEAIKEYAPYESGGGASNFIIPITVPSMGSTKSDQPIPSFSASSDGDSDPYRGLYQGGLVA